MKKIIGIHCLFLCLSMHLYSQTGVGINTINPQGIFDIDGLKNNATTGTPTDAQTTDDVILLTNGNLGIGIINPSTKLYVNGTARITNLPITTGPTNLSAQNISSLFADANGNMMKTPKGFDKIAGGFRSGSGTRSLFIADTQSTILLVRFMIHTDQSNETNNKELAACAYGDLVLIGYGSANPIKIVSADIRGYDGLTKASTINAAKTSINIDLGTQQPFTIDINQTTGLLSISTNVSAIALSYLFEFFGGI